MYTGLGVSALFISLHLTLNLYFPQYFTVKNGFKKTSPKLEASHRTENTCIYLAMDIYI